MGGGTYFFKVPEKSDIECINNENTLNFNMYSFKSRRINYLSEEDKQCLYNLKGKVINNLPIMGSFCSLMCTLEDIVVTNIYIDYRFKFERESIIQQEGGPKIVIKHIPIEGRHYFKRGLALTLCSGIAEEKTAVSVMYAAIDYLKLSTNPGYEFIFTLSRFKPLSLESNHFEKIREYFNGKFETAPLEHGEENLKCVVMGDVLNKERDSSAELKCSVRSKSKAVEFSVKDSSGFKRGLTIDENGRIRASMFIDRGALEEIVNYIGILTLLKEGNALLEPIEPLISDFCNKVHQSMTEEGRTRLKMKIYGDIKDFINEVLSEHCIKEKPSNIYDTMLINSTLKLGEEAHKLKLEVSEDTAQYPDLSNFLNKHTRGKHEEKSKSEKNKAGKSNNQKSSEGIKLMKYLIQSSLGDEEELVSAFKDLMDMKDAKK